MERHEKSCCSETQMKFKETEYGASTSVRKQLEEIGIISADYKISFISFDIETVPQKVKYNDQDLIEQTPISIGYFDGQNGHVLTGENIVKTFVQEMEKYQVR